MALKDILEANSGHNQKIEISEERIAAIMPQLKQYIAFWREYPDLFVDFIQTGGDPNMEPPFKLFLYQRVFLRAAMRYKYNYFVFSRGFSKSFLTILVIMIRCILYPNVALFVTSEGKQQSAQIVQEKVQDICTKIPAFNREIDRSRGKTRESKDSVKYIFKNGSYFANVAASERSRGLRFTGGVIEEAAKIDGDILSKVILPMMAVDRTAMDGQRHKEETINKSQIYITSSGYRNTFSYQKLIQILVWMVTEPDKAFIMGGSYRIPVLVGLQDRNYINDMKRDGTYNEATFDMEFMSKWSGTSENAFFNGDSFDENRVLQLPEYEANGRNGNGCYYVIGFDVGRKGDMSVATVIKVVPQQAGGSYKNLVNIHVWENMHMEEQAIRLKKLYYQYKADKLVIDGNGLGIGFIDYMVKTQYNPDTDEMWPDFGVDNDDDGFYKKFKTNHTEQNAIYIVKANAPINTEAHANLQVQINSGHLRLLIEERNAKTKLLGTKKGQMMTPEERADYLKPFTLTSILKEELLNLREENEGVNIILKQANRSIPKDKVSSLEYALYYIKQYEDSKRRRKKFNVKDWIFLN